MGALNPGDIVKDHKSVLLPLFGIAAVLLFLAFFYQGGGDYFRDSQISQDAPSISGGDKPTYSDLPDMQLKAGADYRAKIKTSKGTIEVDLLEDNAPETVNNFVFLAQEGFYDGLTFHRTISNFMIQGGDPDGNGSGGPGYKFADEINPDSLGLDAIYVRDADFLSSFYSTSDASTMGYAPNSLREHADKTLAEFYADVIGYTYDYTITSVPFEPGVMAMANSGPNTNGSQFFITTSKSETGYLNGRHTVFGVVVDGQRTVDNISRVRTDDYDRPTEDVVIERITITTGE